MRWLSFVCSIRLPGFDFVGGVRYGVPSVLIPAACWAAIAAAGCMDEPASDDASGPRIVAKWDPLACGAPHRVALELADEEGRRISSSALCASGGLKLEAPHLGVYVGRIYAWTLGQAIRSVMPVQIDVDESTERWTVATPE
jgi:hypothetical protein